MEIWKDIPNYEGYYQVSNLGNVRSIDRVIKNRKAEYLFKTGEINYKQKFEMENDLGLF